VPEARVGDYTVIHVGFALTILDEAEALQTLNLLQQLGGIEEELGSNQSADALIDETCA
jgi:hydrogenase expression/formation protein HypC